MKHFSKRSLLHLSMLPVLIFILTFSVYSQDYSENIQRTARFERPNSPDNTLSIHNINGSVTVEGYDGDEIRVEANKEISSTFEDDIKRGKEELTLEIEQDGNRIYVFIDAPFIEVRKRNGRINYRIDRWDDDYDFLFDITVKVPENTHLHASTINRGRISIDGTLGDISASNVNGEVVLKNISGQTRAHTVNGDITAFYLNSPTQNSEYETVNGTIEVRYPEDLSADIYFKSLHGDLYTDFSNLSRLKTQVKSEKRGNNRGITYRIDKFAPVRIGNGGPEFRFEVLNGDVYVKRIKS